MIRSFGNPTRFHSAVPTLAGVFSGTDNREIVDTQESQKLKADDVRAMKDSGVETSELIKTIIKGNEAFTKKTEYSQEKWVERASKRYAC